MTRRPAPDPTESLTAQLRQIDDYERKGLMRAEEAAAQRDAVRRRLMQVLLPDTPAPRLGWRVRLRAIGFMVVLVGSVTLYLLSGHAGLRRRSEEILDAGKVVQAQHDASRREQAERRAAGLPVGPDANGVFPTAAKPAAPASGAAAVAPLLAGRVSLAPALASRAAPEDIVYLVVRTPDDPTGLPLAAVRKQVADLPWDFRIGALEAVGDPRRLMQARDLLVAVRITKTVGAIAHPGDLQGSTHAAPFDRGVAIVVDEAVPAP